MAYYGINDTYLACKLELEKPAEQMTLLLPEEEQMLPTQLTDKLAERHAKELLDKLEEEFTTQEAYDVGEALEMGKSTVKDHLSLALESKLIERWERGKYRKL